MKTAEEYIKNKIRKQLDKQKKKDIKQLKYLYCFFWILAICSFFGFGVLFIFVFIGMSVMLSLFFVFMMVSCLAITLNYYLSLNKKRKQK